MANAAPHADEGWDKLERLVLDLQNMSADGFRTGGEQISKAFDLLESVGKDFATRGEAAAQAVKDIMGAVQDLRKATTQADELQQTIADLEAQLAQREQEIAAQKEAALQLEKRLSEQDQALQASKQRVGELERGANEARARLEEEQTAKTALEQQLDDLENTVNARTTDIGQARERIKELEAALEGKDQESAAAAQRAETAEQAQAETAAALDSLKKQFDETKASQEAADAEMHILKQEAESLRKQMGQIRGQREHAEQAATRTAELEEAVKAAEERASALADQLKEETSGGTKASVAEQLAKALRDQETAKEEHRKLRAEVKRLKAAVSKAETAARKEEPHAPSPPETAIVLEAEPEPEPAGPATPTLPDAEGRRWKLGEILWEMGVITLEQLEDALEEQQRNPQAKIGVILQEKGYASPEAVAQAVALRAETEYVEVDADAITPEVAQLIPARLAALHKCIPIRADEETVTLAMANALDIVAIEDVERVSQRRVEPVVATEPRILEIIGQVYEQSSSLGR